MLAYELFILILTQIKVKYLIFPALFTQNLQKLKSIYSPTSFTVRHQGHLLDAPDVPCRTALGPEVRERRSGLANDRFVYMGYSIRINRQTDRLSNIQVWTKNGIK